MTQCDCLHGVLHTGSNSYPLMPIQDRRTQITLFAGRCPDRGKAIFNQQFRYQTGISSIVLLLPWFGRADLRRMTHLAVDSQFLHQIQKPPHRTGGFDPHADRRGKRRAELSNHCCFVLQSLLDNLAIKENLMFRCFRLLPRMGAAAYFAIIQLRPSG